MKGAAPFFGIVSFGDRSIGRGGLRLHIEAKAIAKTTANARLRFDMT